MITTPGPGVMISPLMGNAQAVEALTESTGKELAALSINEDRLLLNFTDGSAIKLFDDGQLCCELRYMYTDDELQDFVGSQFLSAEVREGPEIEREYEVKESEFLLITTSIGQFTVVNYNEHNGYYGGFAISAVKI